jgi:hypothetical protein
MMDRRKFIITSAGVARRFAVNQFARISFQSIPESMEGFCCIEAKIALSMVHYSSQ